MKRIFAAALVLMVLYAFLPGCGGGGGSGSAGSSDWDAMEWDNDNWA